SGYKRARNMMNGYWERRAALGADDNPYSAAFFQQVCISETDAQCEKEWWPHVDYFFNKCLHLYPGTSEAPGYRTEASMRAGIVAQFGNPPENMGIDKTWKQLVNEGYILAGSPETVRQQVEELAKTLRVGHVLLGCHIGSAPAELVNRSTRLAGEQILPKLKHIYADYEERGGPKALPPARGPAREGGREYPGGGRAMTEPKSRMVELGPSGPTLEVQEAGSGPPLFFLHGAGGVTWDGGLGLLARHFHVYAPCMPGFGKSP